MQLVRFFQNNVATLGVIKVNDLHLPIFTLELPWRDNKDDISCIPVGQYKIIPHHSAKYPDTFEIVGVPGRDAILIHIGNYPRDTKGCVLVGMGILPDQPMINNSGTALKYLHSLIDGKENDLEIITI